MKARIDAQPIRNFLPEDITRYFRYNGSLTTPGCFESVVWTVFDQKQTISHRQVRNQYKRFFLIKDFFLMRT